MFRRCLRNGNRGTKTMNGNDPNPYQAPVSGRPQLGTEPTGNPLLPPAIFIIVIVILYVPLFCVQLLGMFTSVYREINSKNSVEEIAGYVTGGILFPICILIAHIITFRGAIHMLRLKNFGTARTAAIVACIPLCSPCMLFGIPFGIWALVLLYRPEVQAMFSERQPAAAANNNNNRIEHRTDPSIDEKFSRADEMLPREIRGMFAKERYAVWHGSFINLFASGSYLTALSELVRVATLFEHDGHSLSSEFWELLDELAVDCDCQADYRDWRKADPTPRDP